MRCLPSGRSAKSTKAKGYFGVEGVIYPNVYLGNGQESHDRLVKLYDFYTADLQGVIYAISLLS